MGRVPRFIKILIAGRGLVVSRLLFVNFMLAGSIVMLIGCLFLIGYKRIAAYTALAGHSTGSTSGAEQMLTILGSLLLVFGFGCFLFF
jgi:hypothetical protein